ncbi:MAG: ATP-dependent DNA ligase, partial [Limisphaerales bacterium]
GKPKVEGFPGVVCAKRGERKPPRPYPFFLASPIEIKLKPGETLPGAFGEIAEWQFEWKWDGIRAQLIHRNSETCIWSRGDEMVTDSFPELEEAGNLLPNGTVLDGEIVAWRNNAPLPFAHLQRRLGRRNVAERIREEFPVTFLAYDLLELDGTDLRNLPLTERRTRLEQLIETTKKKTIARQPSIQQSSFNLFGDEEETGKPTIPLQLSPRVHATSWEELESLQNQSRERGVEGLMFKRNSSTYGTGRTRGDWWKWKIEPFHIDAVLIYAQRGSGRRASLYTDYTFGLWESGKLVPVAKAYSGLTDAEIRRVDAFVRNNTLDKHGPVRIVKPELVFELAFEGIQESTRHKAGIALRFPRMHRWREDKKPDEADTIETLRALLRSTRG